MAEHTMSERLADLEARRQEALHAGPERAVQRQHDKGKMLARERIDYLLDEGSFHELDMLARHRAHDDRARRRRRVFHRNGGGFIAPVLEWFV